MAIGAVLGLALALAGGPAAAEGSQGAAVIDAVELAAGQVTLDGVAYRVTDSTQLEDEQGGRLEFAQLPSVASGASVDAAAVWFEASEASGGTPAPLTLLRLTGSVPR